jgi:hypothetical protein
MEGGSKGTSEDGFWTVHGMYTCKGPTRGAEASVRMSVQN